MREYRVVVTLDETHIYNGMRVRHEAVSPIYGRSGHYHNRKTTFKAQALEWLAEAKEKCPVFDRMTYERHGRDAIWYTQTNIRLQSREITEWENEE